MKPSKLQEHINLLEKLKDLCYEIDDHDFFGDNSGEEYFPGCLFDRASSYGCGIVRGHGEGCPAEKFSDIIKELKEIEGKR